MPNEQDIDDGLTEEERAALVDEEDGGTNTDPKDGANDDAEAAAEAAAAAEAEAAAKATDDAAAAAAAAAATDPAATDAASISEGEQKSAPILVAPPPEDADAKLADIEARKEALLTQFDDGDITAKDYQKQLDVLAKEERSVEMAKFEAGIAQKMEQQRLQNDWNKTCEAFVDSHAVYKEMPWAYKELDAKVRDLASKPETAQWSGQKFLDEAHKELVAKYKFPETPKADDKQDKRKERELPPNLAKVPAANVEDTNGGRFAVLDRLANTDPVAYEETLNKMSQAERDAYLNA